MFAFVNGQFVPEERAVVSILDRGFLYGDGLFETLRVSNSEPFRWTQHMERLRHGAEFLKIKLPFTPATLHKFATELIAKNKMPEALLRLTLSRGIGARGYSPKGATRPTLAMTLHPLFGRADLPVGQDARQRVPTMKWKLVTSSLRLPAGDPLAHFKTANKLAQVLARAEADAVNADEALLLNTAGHVAETTSGNVFWIERGAVCTPPLDTGVLPGVTRAAVLEVCGQIGLSTQEKNIFPDQLHQAEGLFLSLSSWGVVEVSSLDGRTMKTSLLMGKIRRVKFW